VNNRERRLIALQFEAGSEAKVLVLGTQTSFPAQPHGTLEILVWPIAEIVDDTGGWAQSDTIDMIALTHRAAATEFYQLHAGKWIFSGRCLQSSPASPTAFPEPDPHACDVSATFGLIETFLAATGMVCGEQKSVTILA
jgi:hypothetical protein